MPLCHAAFFNLNSKIYSKQAKLVQPTIYFFINLPIVSLINRFRFNPQSERKKKSEVSPKVQSDVFRQNPKYVPFAKQKSIFVWKND